MPKFGGAFLSVGELQLECARLPARKRGPTLLLLHEGLGCVALWKDFPTRLAHASGLEVLTYSRAGYGASSAAALPWPIDYHRREALDVLPLVLDAAAIEECILVGHSDGASIALIYAGAKVDLRVRGVAVLAPHVLTETKCVRNIRAAQQAYTATTLRENLRRYHGDNVDCAFRGWSETWLDARFSSWNIEHYLPAITVPILSVRGDDDPYNTIVHLERIAAGVSGSLITVQLSACGHAPHIDQPSAVIHHINDLVARVGSERASNHLP